MKQRLKLLEMLRQPGITIAPGAYDAWSARIIEKAGFPAVYMTGYGASASVLGAPDIGLMTMSEMATHAKNIASAINIPLIADADTGGGGILNVIRTVKEYEKGGVAAIQLEDQVTPKRCGHMEGKELVAEYEMVAKIKAAISARNSEDFEIIARTDARATNGIEDAIKRSIAYQEAGADIIFFEAPQSVDEMKEVASIIKVPLIANMVEGGKTPLLSANELAAIGYKLVIWPSGPLYAATKSLISLMETLKTTGSTSEFSNNMVDFNEFFRLVGTGEARDLEKSFIE